MKEEEEQRDTKVKFADEQVVQVVAADKDGAESGSSDEETSEEEDEKKEGEEDKKKGGPKVKKEKAKKLTINEDYVKDRVKK